MKRLYIFSVLFFLFFVSEAQDIHVRKMEHDPMDLSARVNTRKDINNDFCALVKVEIPIDGLVFDGNIVGEVKRNVNEYEVYMTAGSRSLIVRHPKYYTLTVKFSDYEVSTLEALETYHIVLGVDRIVETEISKDTAIVIEPIENPINVTNTIKDNDVHDNIEEKNSHIPAPVSLVKNENSIISKPKTNTEIYFGAKAQVLSSLGVGVFVGCNINYFNAEAGLTYGLAKSEEVFVYDKDPNKTSYSYKYSSFKYGAKLGATIKPFEFLRVTLQAGADIVSIKGVESQKGNGNNPNLTDGYAVPLVIGARNDIKIYKNLGISLSLEYSIPLVKSDLYSRLSEVSSDVKSFANGINLNAGLFVVF